jgi:general secretion pathway protein L
MPTWLGIDVGTHSVKVALVRSLYRRTVLDAIVKVEIGSVDGGVEGATRAAVDAALIGAGGPPDAVAVAVDGTRATVRSVGLPVGAIKQVAEVLPFELESQIPFEMSESVFDYRLLPRAAPSSDDEVETADFLVGVVRTEDVTRRITAARDASGVEPEKVGLGGLPLANVLALVPSASAAGAEGSRGPIVVVDLGARTSDVLVLDGGEPVFARTLSQGTDRIETTAPELARELRLTVGAFRALGGAAPDRVLLCGGGSYKPGACTFLSSELSLPVAILPPLTIELGPQIAPERTSELAWFAKALGLALGLGPRPLDLDLRRGPLAFERGFAWVREKIPMLAGLATVVLVSFFFSAWAQMHATSLERDNLEKALALVTKDVLGEETTSAARATELVAQQTTLNDDDPLPHADAFDVMVKLSEDIPMTMTSDIDELDVQKGHVVVHGTVATIADAQSIADALKKEHCFANVKDPRTNQLGSDKQKYALDFDLLCPEDHHGAKKKEPSSAPAASAGGK